MSATATSAVIVTKGDVDLSQILESLPFSDVVVWDNSKRTDLKVYGRYAGIFEAKHQRIFVQDDDCLCDGLPELLDAEGRVCLLDAGRQAQYHDSSLIGFGAVFDRGEPSQAFAQYLEEYPLDDLFLRCCDLIFTSLMPFQRLDIGRTDLPWFDAPDRMHTGDPDHYESHEEVLERCRSLRSTHAKLRQS